MTKDGNSLTIRKSKLLLGRSKRSAWKLTMRMRQLSLFVNNSVICRMLCFVRKVWERREEDVASLFSEGVGPRTIFIETYECCAA